jgi:PAS domain S-box-containing protein
MFDTDSLQITYANDHALESIGYTLEQLQQKTILGLHPESGIESLGAIVEQLRKENQESITYETIQARANGSTYPVEVTLQLITEEGAQKLMAVIHDITARKQAEENIRKFSAPVERRGGRNK